MIIEHAALTIKNGVVKEFLQTIHSAFPLLSSARGYLSHALLQNKEYPNQYILVVYWNSLEDHIERFVGSPEFKKWDSMISKFFDCDPTVLHYTELEINELI